MRIPELDGELDEPFIIPAIVALLVVWVSELQIVGWTGSLLADMIFPFDGDLGAFTMDRMHLETRCGW